MKTLLALRQAKQEKLETLNNLISGAQTEKRSLSDSEISQQEALTSEVRNLNKQIEAAELLADEERSLIGGSKTITENGKPTNTEVRNFVMSGESRSLSAAVDASGGYTVIPALDKEIYKLLRDQSVFRQNATVKTISTQTFEKLVSVGGTTATWAAESDDRNETSTSQLEKVTWSLNALYAYPMTTEELLDWSDFDVSGWLTSEVADESGQKEEAAFWNGDGVKKPTGLLTYTTTAENDAVRAFGTIQEIETASTAIASDDLITLAHTLKKGYRGSAKFFMNDATQEKIRKLKTSDNDYLWRAGLMEGQANTLLGKVVETAEQIPDDYIVYGDLAKAYYITDHTSGVRMRKDNITKPGFVKMYTSRYVGGGLVDSNAIKFMKVAAA
ncbi:phage major capsid protein [Alteromonas sp. RKMC-009]|uniref:phage major capsid protein n=1 Tax=Alteromonas sp. RKMC-009 TaxID=2267264 RepID=UPI000E68D59E|nr:phage major capsid protein [Alteromonas sp. RKMC-009]AYA64785.1 phage major capsid protein [Alteromonas sp. RKMC-009]